MRACSRVAGQRAKRRGLVTFEWILLFTIVVIGIIGGAMAVRIAVSHEQANVESSINGLNFPADTSVPVLHPAVAPKTVQPAAPSAL